LLNKWNGVSENLASMTRVDALHGTTSNLAECFESGGASMILPMPLTIMEELFLLEDRPSYPSLIFARAVFSGQLDRRAFDIALKAAVERHPFFRAIVKQNPAGCWEWVEAPQAPDVVWGAVSATEALPPVTWLNLRREVGLRVRVAIDAAANRSTILFQIHHSVCDAQGAYTFIGDFLVAYALEMGAAADLAKFAELDEGMLSGRGRFKLTFAKLLKRRLMVALHGVGLYFMHQPCPLIPHVARASYATLPMGYPGLLAHHFHREETIRLSEVAKAHDVALNDLLIRDLFLALLSWRRERGLNNGNEWLRIMIPMNLRQGKDRFLPACNLMSFALIDRRASAGDQPDQLLRSFHDVMQMIKKTDLGLNFIFGLQVRRYLPGGLVAATRGERCLVSTIFSNVGQAFPRIKLPRQDGHLVAGNLVLEQFEGYTPIRPYMSASFLVGLYAEQLYATMHFDPAVIDDVTGKKVLYAFVNQISVTARCGSHELLGRSP
jgi:hypothetical protein